MSDRTSGISRAGRKFLANMGIPEHYVADMRHRKEWVNCSEELREVGRYFAWGFRTCTSGHRLTNSRGRCIQCHPATIGFVLRHTRPGWLYVAQASGVPLTKIGIARDVAGRLVQLNAHRLAGVESWEPVYSDYCERPAALEAELHRRLSDYRQAVPYERKGGQMGREVFACRPHMVLNVLAQIYAERAEW